MLLDVGFPLNSERSVALARRIRAQHRRCWRNAALAVSHLGPGARYVEGWIVTAGTVPYVIEHGWCEVDGEIVDPTYAPHVTPDPPPLAHIVGARFTAQQAEAALRDRLPIVLDREPASHWRAFEVAWRMATARAGLDPAPTTQVVHCRNEPFDVYIARPSPWANPFHIGTHGSREDVITRYCKRVVRHPGLLRMVWSLRGQTLGCRCHPLPCHGDVLAELANVEHVRAGMLLARWLGPSTKAASRRRQEAPAA